MKRSLIMIFLILFLFIPTINGNENNENVLIKHVYYYAFPNENNEFVSIFNENSISIDISGWKLEDGEGILTFPDNCFIEPNKELYVAEDSESFKNSMGFYPDYCFSDLYNSGFKLNNNGDEVALYDNNDDLIDIVIYGDSDYTGKGWNGGQVEKDSAGWVLERSGDTNSSEDWSYILLGSSDFEISEFQSDIKIVASPDNSYSEFLNFTNQTENFLLISVYQFTSLSLAQHLINLNVELKILLEGNPVGGIPENEKYVVNYLYENGAKICFMMNNDTLGIYDRFTYTHAKYMIRDNESVMLFTENFGDTGIPSGKGNRGYGLIMDGEIAEYYANVFYYDFNFSFEDCVRYDDEWIDSSYDSLKYESFESVFSPIDGNAVVEPLIAPDFALEKIIDMFQEADERILIEAMNMDDLFIDLLLDISCEIRVLLDSYWYNYDDNMDTVNILKDNSIDAKLIDLDVHNLVKLHAKIMIIDDSVIIGSMNFGEHSYTKNREVGVIIHSKEIADYMAEIFEYDYKDDVSKPVAVINCEKKIDLNENIILDASNSTDNNAISMYIWLLDGVEIYNGTHKKIDYTFDKVGTYYITLKVIDYCNNTATSNIKIIVESDSDSQNILYEYWYFVIILIVLIISAVIYKKK